MPELAQAFAAAQERVVVGDREGGDVLIGPGAFAGEAFVDIPGASVRIGAYDAQVVAAKILVTDASRDDDDIAGMNFHFATLFAAEMNER